MQNRFLRHIVCLGLGMFVTASEASAGSVPLFTTPAWGRPGSLLVRVVAGGEGFLIKREGGAVYRFEPRGPRLILEDETNWQPSGTPVLACNDQVPARDLRIDPKTGVLSAGNRTVELSGFAITSRTSPSGRYAAVLIGAGVRSSLAPALGQGTRGPYTHTVISLPQGVVVPPIVGLPFDARESAIVFCWSPDERFVIYSDVLLTRAAIVTVNTTGVDK